MKVKKHIKLTISIGSNDNYFVRENGIMVAGFIELLNAELFCDVYCKKYIRIGHSTEIIKLMVKP